MKILRRRWLINRPLQIKIIALLGGVTTLWAALTMVYTYNKMMANVALYRFPEDYNRIFLTHMAAGIGFMILYLIVVGFVITNRLAGPIWRLEEDLRQILSGKDIGTLKTRKNDEFKELPKLINELLARSK